MDWLTGVTESDAEHFTAQAFMTYQMQSRGIVRAEFVVDATVVAVFQPYIYGHLVKETGAEESAHWAKVNRLPLARGRYEGRDVSIAYLPVGAPAAVMYLEALAVLGARNVIAVGAAGSLQEYAPTGSAVLPVSAVREEGTSYHYQPSEVAAVPDAEALVALRTACAEGGVVPHEGPAWTTDAPFRELTSKVRRHAAAGVVAVDMEASALFIVGATRGVRVGSLFVVSDELFHPWAPAFFDRAYRQSANRIAECALTAAVRLGES